MRQAQINVRTRACSRTSIARTKQAALTHNVRGKELNSTLIVFVEYSFSHVPLPYNKFHVSLKGCSQIIKIGTFING